MVQDSRSASYTGAAIASSYDFGSIDFDFTSDPHAISSSCSLPRAGHCGTVSETPQISDNTRQGPICQTLYRVVTLWSLVSH